MSPKIPDEYLPLGSRIRNSRTVADKGMAHVDIIDTLSDLWQDKQNNLFTGQQTLEVHFKAGIIQDVYISDRGKMSQMKEYQEHKASDFA